MLRDDLEIEEAEGIVDNGAERELTIGGVVRERVGRTIVKL